MTKLNKIIMHWTAGSHQASAIDRKHYHEVVQGDGKRVTGDLLPEANESTRDGHYAAHTRRLNTGSVGLAMCAMRGAVERPFNAGSDPVTRNQLDVFVCMVAEYCDTYGIAVTRRTVLTHAEVQPTLGVAQRGKWDICWVPGMSKPGDPVKVGDEIRRMVTSELRRINRASMPWWKRWTR